MSGQRMWVGIGALVVATALAVTAWAADDDLAVVKRAVAVQTAEAQEDLPAPAPRTVRRKAGRPQWLKVSVTDDRNEDKRVSVNVPLGLLGLLGKDATVDLASLGVPGVKAPHREVRIADLIDSLEPGTVLVEVHEKDSHIRIWVE